MNVLLQRMEGERTYSEMFRKYRTRVFIAMSAQALAQLNGINVISYYAPLVFESAGWHGQEAIKMTGINGITYLLSTIPPWYIVDRWGRRFILLSGAVAMAISLSCVSYFLYLNIDNTPTLVVISVMVYNAAFGYSWGPVSSTQSLSTTYQAYIHRFLGSTHPRSCPSASDRRVPVCQRLRTGHSTSLLVR